MPDEVRKAGEVIETTVSEIAAELERRGLDPHDHVTITIAPDDWLTKARRASRRLVIAAALSDDDIDRMIKQAQHEVEPKLG
jgi:hypothetical protein